MKNSKRNRSIIELVDSGATYSEVSEKCGVSRGVVAGVINRHKVNLICGINVCAPPEGKRKPHGYAIQFTDAIKKMASEGLTPNKIAINLGIGRQSVVNIIKANDFNLVNGVDLYRRSKLKKSIESANEIRDALDRNHFDIEDTANELGWSTDDLIRHCKQYKINAGNNMTKHQMVAACAIALRRIDNCTLSKIAWVMNTTPQSVNNSLRYCNLSLDSVDYLNEIKATN